MKLKKIILIAALSFAGAFLPVAAEAAEQYYYSTDIVAYLDGLAVPSYNIGGQTVVLAEDLEPYGFQVLWDGEERTINVFTQAMPGLKPSYVPERAKVVGVRLGQVYPSDVRAYVNGIVTESYNIGGRTALVLEDMAALVDPVTLAGAPTFLFNIHYQRGYSDACMKALWDPQARAIFLSCLRPGSEIETNLGLFRISGSQLTLSTFSGNGFIVEETDSQETSIKVVIALDEFNNYNSAKWEYVSLEDLLGAFEAKYTIQNGVLDLESSSFGDNSLVGTKRYAGRFVEKNLLPLDISLAVDGVAQTTPAEAIVAFEYYGEVYLRHDLLSQVIGKELFKNKDALPEEAGIQ